jgi:hypothetical protein
VSRLAPLAFLCTLAFVLAACAEPPNKEMNQAEGAIEAARAAGAEKYAAQEFTAAVDALRRSQEAVTQNDYRLALNHAIDSRTRAQAAAKLAVEARAKARGDAERSIAEAAALVVRANERIKTMEVDGVGARALQPARARIGHADKSLQEARAALKVDDYARATTHSSTVAKSIEAALAGLDKIPPPSRTRRKR